MSEPLDRFRRNNILHCVGPGTLRLPRKAPTTETCWACTSENTFSQRLLDLAIGRALEGAQQTIRSAYQLATISPRKDNLFADVLLSCALAKTDDLGAFAAQDVRDPMQAITGKAYDIPNYAQHLAEFSDPKRGNILKKFGAKKRFRYRFSNPLMQPFVIMRGFSEQRITGETLEKLAQPEAGRLF